MQVHMSCMNLNIKVCAFSVQKMWVQIPEFMGKRAWCQRCYLSFLTRI